MQRRIAQTSLIVIAVVVGAVLVGCRDRKKPEFLWSDAWVLTAIFWAQRADGQVSLMKIIAYGDLTNIAIFNPEELESGLARLTEAGLVKENAGRFRPAGEATAWYSEFLALNQNNNDSMLWMEAKLHSAPYRDGHDPRNNRHYPGFTKAKFDEAVASYHVWFDRHQAQTATR